MALETYGPYQAKRQRKESQKENGPSLEQATLHRNQGSMHLRPPQCRIEGSAGVETCRGSCSRLDSWDRVDRMYEERSPSGEDSLEEELELATGGLSNPWTDSEHQLYLSSVEDLFTRKFYQRQYCEADICGEYSRRPVAPASLGGGGGGWGWQSTAGSEVTAVEESEGSVRAAPQQPAAAINASFEHTANAPPLAPPPSGLPPLWYLPYMQNLPPQQPMKTFPLLTVQPLVRLGSLDTHGSPVSQVDQCPVQMRWEGANQAKESCLPSVRHLETHGEPEAKVDNDAYCEKEQRRGLESFYPTAEAPSEGKVVSEKGMALRQTSSRCENEDVLANPWVRHWLPEMPSGRSRYVAGADMKGEAPAGTGEEEAAEEASRLLPMERCGADPGALYSVKEEESYGGGCGSFEATGFLELGMAGRGSKRKRNKGWRDFSQASVRGLDHGHELHWKASTAQGEALLPASSCHNNGTSSQLSDCQDAPLHDVPPPALAFPTHPSHQCRELDQLPAVASRAYGGQQGDGIATSGAAEGMDFSRREDRSCLGKDNMESDEEQQLELAHGLEEDGKGGEDRKGGEPSTIARFDQVVPLLRPPSATCAQLSSDWPFDRKDDRDLDPSAFPPTPTFTLSGRLTPNRSAYASGHMFPKMAIVQCGKGLKKFGSVDSMRHVKGVSSRPAYQVEASVDLDPESSELGQKHDGNGMEDDVLTESRPRESEKETSRNWTWGIFGFRRKRKDGGGRDDQ